MFWDNFKELCENHGETPNGVCKKLNFSNATATHWKNGKSPNSNTLQKIADYFGVTTDYLLGKMNDQSLSENKKTPSGEPNGVTLDPNRQLLQDLMSKLSPAKQKQGLEYIEFLVEQEEKEKKP